jgi:RNA polymerase sigma-70 factor (ECF subfamily)
MDVMTEPHQTPANPGPDRFEQLYRENRDDLYAYVAGLLRDRITAEDVTALAFERAFRKWNRFDPAKGSPRGWLFGIARNASLDELRRRKRDGRMDADIEDSAPGQEQVMVEVERRQAVSKALGKLPAAEREIIALKFFSGLSNSEIAEATGISASNVGTRVHRAITRLRGLSGGIE